MADLQTSLNENLIGEGLNTSSPSTTYVDFGQQIAKNQAEQASQEQALAMAKERVKQAKFQTANEQGAQDAGVNPLLMDVMTPEQAVAYLRLILKEKGLTITESDIDSWAKTLTGPVNRNIVEAFANRFARESTRALQPTEVDSSFPLKIPAGSSASDLGLDNAVDGSGKSVDDKEKSDGTFTANVPADGMYSIVYDNQGNVKKVLPAGKAPVDSTKKDAAKAAESTEKQWQKLDAQINTAFKTRSGGLGALSTAIFRAVRAINTINATENLTAQDLANISQDVAGIFQGGAPTVVTAKDNDYSLTLLGLQNWFRAQTGILANVGHIFGKEHDPLGPTKAKLLQVCTDLRDSAIDNLKAYTESEEPAYREIIEANPQRWTDMQDKKIKFIESGLLVPPYSKSDPSRGNSPLNITGMDQAQETKRSTTPSTGKVPKYTVVEDGK